MPKQQPNQVLVVGTLISITVVVLAVAALTAAESSKGDTGIAFGLVFMVTFYFVSLPLHSLLALGTVLHSIRVGLRPFRWIYAYLLLAVVIHVSIAAQIGAFDKLEQRLVDWQRGRDMPTQVALERAVAQPTDIAAVRAAIAAGANPNAILPGVPLTPLFTAAMRGEAALVTVLLEGGADPNRRAAVNSGFGGVAITNPYPLDAAAFSDSSERLAVVQQLLAFGADAPVSHARLGACAHGDLPLYELVVSAGAPDKPDNKGNRCLHFAARRDQPALAAQALMDDADPNVANLANQRPLDVAIIRKSFSTALEIAQRGGIPNDPELEDRVVDTESPDPAHSSLRKWILENRR